MSDTAPVETTSPAEDEPKPTEQPEAKPAEASTEPEPTEQEPNETKPGDPDAVIAALRKENARNRVAAREAREAAEQATQAAAQAAEKAKQDIVESFSQVFGIKKTEEPVDPATLLEQSKAEIEQARAEAAKSARQARRVTVENALYRAAGPAGADADALLDSRKVLDSVKDLDPAATDFADRLAEVITQAVEDNPAKFRKARPAAPRSGGDLSAGNGEPADKPTGVAAIIAQRRKNSGLFK